MRDAALLARTKGVMLLPILPKRRDCCLFRGAVVGGPPRTICARSGLGRSDVWHCALASNLTPAISRCLADQNRARCALPLFRIAAWVGDSSVRAMRDARRAGGLAVDGSASMTQGNSRAKPGKLCCVQRVSRRGPTPWSDVRR